MTNEERPAWRSRIVGHGEEDPAKLAPNPRNWRKHPRRQRAALEEVLDRVGWVQDVVVNRRTGHLVDGHLRANAAAARGEALIPVVYVDLSIDEERLVLAALDPLAGLARTDADQLRELLGDVDLGEGALASMFGKQQAVALGSADPDVLPDPAPEPYVRLGEVYELGDHLLLCGDATSRSDVATLIGGARAELMFTDPPYGVSYGREGSGGKNAIAGDLSQAAIPVSFAVALEIALDDNARVYICGGSSQFGMYAALFDHHLRQHPHPLIWVKESFVMRPNNYHSQFEIIYYGWRGVGGGSKFWHGDRKQSDVWQISRDREGGKSLHPAQKPVELVEVALRNSSAPGGIVFDPFVGSGTTIIAAERLARRCRAIEIDPVLAQVAIERWQAFTGREAKRVGGRGE